MLVLFSACKKFEEGPRFSLISKKQRLTNDWSYVSIINRLSGEVQTAGFEGWLEILKNDGSYEKKIYYFGKESVFSGTWEYDGKNTLRLDYTMYDVPITNIYTIKRLAADELWLVDATNEIQLEAL